MENKIFFVASDIHGSLDALTETINLAKVYNADKIILLGDIFGAHATEMVEELNAVSHKLTIVRGNNDWYFDEEAYGANFKIFDVTYENINGKIAYLSHGHKTQLEKIDEYGAKLVLVGHYHRPILREQNGKILLCPGSMQQPRSMVGKTFAVISDGKIKIMTPGGDLVIEMDIM